MQYLDRLFTILLSLMVVVISVGLMGYSLGLIDGMVIINYLEMEPLIVGIVSLIAFLISLRLLQLSFARKKSKETVIVDSELGNIKMSLGAVKKLLKTIIKQETEVTDIDSKIKVKNGGIDIHLDLAITSPENISNLAQHLQQAVKSQVTETTGAVVNKVEILIKEVNRDKSKKGSKKSQGYIEPGKTKKRDKAKVDRSEPEEQDASSKEAEK